MSTAFDFAAEVPGYLPISTESPVDAYDRVLAYAGAFPRDTVDASDGAGGRVSYGLVGGRIHRRT